MAPAAGGRPPNIVFILADDMGYGDFSCFNEGRSSTPVLDQLVAEGTTLTQHYSASPVCAPARASLLTGRYPHRTGAIDTLEGRGLDRIALDEVTVADLLRRAGYVTGLVGKWHNGAFDDRYHPNQRGFDEFVGFRGGWSDYWNWRLDRNGSIGGSDGRHLTDVLTEEACAFVTRHAGAPFFLHLAYSAPHFPLQSHPQDAAPFLESGTNTTAVANLYGMLRGMDRGIGQLLQQLSDLGLLDDTLVVFSSDNGPQFGGEGDSSTTRFNCGFRGAKLLVHEGGIRLPAVLRWPNGLAARGSVDDLVHFTDWLPTLLAAAGVSVAAEVGRAGGLPLDGVDVLPLLRDEGGSVPTTRFWQWNRYEPVAMCNAAMRDGAWKLVHPALPEAMEVLPADLAQDVALKYRSPEGVAITTTSLPPRSMPVPPAPQLFDLSVDPFEADDVAAAHPGRVAAMAGALGSWFEEVELDRRRAH
jgi:arylsulfatase A